MNGPGAAAPQAGSLPAGIPGAHGLAPLVRSFGALLVLAPAGDSPVSEVSSLASPGLPSATPTPGAALAAASRPPHADPLLAGELSVSRVPLHRRSTGHLAPSVPSATLSRGRPRGASISGALGSPGEGAGGRRSEGLLLSGPALEAMAEAMAESVGVLITSLGLSSTLDPPSPRQPPRRSGSGGGEALGAEPLGDAGAWAGGGGTSPRLPGASLDGTGGVAVRPGAGVLPD